ncbi:hypothetical protein [Pseudoduganella violaceinigra]|nr:hypothetical protein [Pseudoduganella violaceinigra]
MAYPKVPCTGPNGVRQVQAAPGGPGGLAQHQNWGVKQMLPGRCGGT